MCNNAPIFRKETVMMNTEQSSKKSDIEEKKNLDKNRVIRKVVAKIVLLFLGILIMIKANGNIFVLLGAIMFIIGFLTAIQDMQKISLLLKKQRE